MKKYIDLRLHQFWHPMDISFLHIIKFTLGEILVKRGQGANEQGQGETRTETEAGSWLAQFFLRSAFSAETKANFQG